MNIDDFVKDSLRLDNALDLLADIDELILSRRIPKKKDVDVLKARIYDFINYEKGGSSNAS